MRHNFFKYMVSAVGCAILICGGCKPTNINSAKMAGSESALLLLDSARGNIMSNPHVTQRLIDSLEVVLPQFQNDSLMLLFYRLQGEYYGHISDTQASDFYFGEALKINFPGCECVKAEILSYQAECSNEAMDAERALALTGTAERLLEHCPASESVYYTSYRVAVAKGLAFFLSRQLDSTFFQMNKAIRYAKKLDNPDSEFMAYKYLEYIYAELKDPVLSKRYSTKADALAEKAGDGDPVFCNLINRMGGDVGMPLTVSADTDVLKKENKPAFFLKAKELMRQGHPRLTMAYVKKQSEMSGAVSDTDRIRMARDFVYKYKQAEKDAVITNTHGLIQKYNKRIKKLQFILLLLLLLLRLLYFCKNIWLKGGRAFFLRLRQRLFPTPAEVCVRSVSVTPIAAPIPNALYPQPEEADSALPNRDASCTGYPVCVHPVIDKLRSYMEKDKLYLDPQLSLESLASKMDISRSYLSEIINKNLQKNFTDFVNYYRVEYAKELLTNTRDKMDVISLQCGFGSRQTFYIVFKKSENMTPAEYRKKGEAL